MYRKINFQILSRLLFLLCFTAIGFDDTFSVKSDSAEEVPVFPLSNSQGFYNKKYSYNNTYNAKKTYNAEKPAYSNSYSKPSYDGGYAAKKPSYGGDTQKSYDYSKQAAGNAQYKSGGYGQQHNEAAYGGYKNEYGKDKSAQSSYNYGSAKKNDYDDKHKNRPGKNYGEDGYKNVHEHDNTYSHSGGHAVAKYDKESSDSSGSSSEEEYGSEEQQHYGGGKNPYQGGAYPMHKLPIIRYQPYNPAGPMPPMIYPPYKMPPYNDYYPPYYYPTPARPKTSTKLPSTVPKTSTTSVQPTQTSSGTTRPSTYSNPTIGTPTTPSRTETTQTLITSTTAEETSIGTSPSTAVTETSTPTSTGNGGGGPPTQVTETSTQSPTENEPSTEATTTTSSTVEPSTVTPTVPTPPVTVTDVTVPITPTTEHHGGGPGTHVTEPPSECAKCTKEQLKLEVGDGDKVPDPICGDPRPGPDGCAFVKLKCETNKPIDGFKMNICFQNASSTECCVESKNGPLFNSVEEVLNCTGTSANQPVWVFNSGACNLFNVSEVNCAVNPIGTSTTAQPTTTTTEDDGGHPGTAVTRGPQLCVNCTKDQLTLVQGDGDKVPDPICGDPQIGQDGCAFVRLSCETTSSQGAKMNICFRNESKECCVESDREPFKHSEALLNCTGTANQRVWVLNSAACSVFDVAEVQCRVKSTTAKHRAKQNKANDAAQFQAPKKARLPLQSSRPSFDEQSSDSVVKQTDSAGHSLGAKKAAFADQNADKATGVKDADSSEQNSSPIDQISDDQISDKASAQKNVKAAVANGQISDKNSDNANKIFDKTVVNDAVSSEQNSPPADQISNKASAQKNAKAAVADGQLPDKNAAKNANKIPNKVAVAKNSNKIFDNASAGQNATSAEQIPENELSSAASDESLSSAEKEDNGTSKNLGSISVPSFAENNRTRHGSVEPAQKLPISSGTKSLPKSESKNTNAVSTNGKSAPAVGQNKSVNVLASRPNGTAPASKNFLA